MSRSVYIRLAVVLVRLDLAREERLWRKAHRRIRYVGPPLSEHLLRDIGFDSDGYAIGSTSPQMKAKREVARIRKRLYSRNLT